MYRKVTLKFLHDFFGLDTKSKFFDYLICTKKDSKTFNKRKLSFTIRSV